MADYCPVCTAEMGYRPAQEPLSRWTSLELRCGRCDFTAPDYVFRDPSGLARAAENYREVLATRVNENRGVTRQRAEQSKLWAHILGNQIVAGPKGSKAFPPKF